MKAIVQALLLTLFTLPSTAESLPEPAPSQVADPPDICAQIPQALRYLRAECASAAKPVPVTIDACLSLVADDPLPPQCQALLDCHDGLPSQRCLRDFPEMIRVVDSCAYAAGHKLVCLYTASHHGTAVTLGIAPGHPQPAVTGRSDADRDAARRKRFSAAGRLLGIRPGRIRAAQDLHAGTASGTTSHVNRSYDPAAPVFIRLSTELDVEPDTYYFVYGTRVEDFAGNTAFRVEIPRHGGLCTVHLTGLYLNANDRTSDDRRRPADQRQRFRELRQRLAVEDLAPEMGLDQCADFRLGS